MYRGFRGWWGLLGLAHASYGIGPTPANRKQAKSSKVRQCKKCGRAFFLSMAEEEYYSSKRMQCPQKCEHCR